MHPFLRFTDHGITEKYRNEDHDSMNTNSSEGENVLQIGACASVQPVSRWSVFVQSAVESVPRASP